MELIRGLHNIRPEHFGCVLTIGNFDGVHLGHQAVLAGLLADAADLSLPATVMLFEPQPREFFMGEKAPARLSRLRDKLAQLKAAGIERVICVSFNDKFATMDASQFVADVLIKKLGVRALTIGDDFRFGRGRTGDFELLTELGKVNGMAVKNTQSFKALNHRVSSTAIRNALADGRLNDAHDMLGYTYYMSGRVMHGWKKGRELGFATANVALKRQVAPVSGVFAVTVLHKEQRYFGVANVGVKPTFQGTKALLEVHIFDFSDDIYGDIIHVELNTKLREEKTFSGLDALTTQIANDVAKAKDYFNLS